MDPTPEPKSRRPKSASRDPLDQLFGSGGGTAVSKKIRSSVGGQLFEYVLEKKSASPVSASGRLLIVDHDRLSRDILSRNLQREGYTVEIEPDGNHALARLGEGNFDMVLWEVELPGLKGLEMLKRVKSDSALRHLPIVLLSEQKDTDTVIRCIEAGADDYLPKPFNPALLKARIRGCLERKNLRDQEQRLLATIKTQQDRLDAELAEAAEYLRSLLPPPTAEPLAIDWRFIPSSEVGGDAFGYHWIDDDHFAVYLLDVCGHGVGAALLSVTVLNVLRSGALQGTDPRLPDAVLGAVNRAFPMEEQHDRYFTLWYGVYQRSTRKMTYGSGGHPPALLLPPAGEPTKLAAKGMMIGGMPNSRYVTQSCEIPPGSRFFLFCDGAYEITRPDGKVFTFDEFTQLLAKIPANAPVNLDIIVDEIKTIRGPFPLEDDLSLISIQF
ncbi:MAG: SpoIIE family protein phosphatase [Methylacidiphilales bacterium]|nr:SpoIIE family protein phosphatase [Candidatus Methylacidiphilales bacterium]